MSGYTYTKIPNWLAVGKEFNPNSIVASYMGWMAPVPGLAPFNISSATWSGNVVTVTTTTPHPFLANQPVMVAGLSPAGYNGCPNVTAQAVFTGYISGTTLTVSSVVSGSIAAGQILQGGFQASNGVLAGTAIISGAGPYTVSVSQTLGSVSAPVTFYAVSPSVTVATSTGASPTFNGYISGTTLTTGTSVTLTTGQFIYGVGVPAGTYVTAGATGTSFTINQAATVGTVGAQVAMTTSTALTLSSGTGVVIGQTVSGTGIAAGTTIISGSGTTWQATPGGQTISSTTMYLGGTTFTYALATNPGLTPVFAGYIGANGASASNVMTVTSASGGVITCSPQTYTGYIAGTTLTVSAIAFGNITTGSYVTGPGVQSNTIVLGQLTGTTGGVGTYLVNNSQYVGLVGSQVTLVGGPTEAGLPTQAGVGMNVAGTGVMSNTYTQYQITGQSFNGYISSGVSGVAGTVLTTSTSVTLVAGQYIYGAGVTPGTYITVGGTGTSFTVNNSQATGTSGAPIAITAAGGVGTYAVNNVQNVGTSGAPITFNTNPTANQRGEVLAAIGGLNLVVADLGSVPTFTAAFTYSALIHMVTGDVATLTLTASDAVQFNLAGGVPSVTLNVNATPRQMVFKPALSTTTSLVFQYTIVAGDVATAGQVTTGSSATFNGATVDELAPQTTNNAFQHPAPFYAVAFTAPSTTGVAIN